ncbi:MAG: KEOPS complex subunit Cgi121 [Halobacteriota archaeon]
MAPEPDVDVDVVYRDVDVEDVDLYLDWLSGLDADVVQAFDARYVAGEPHLASAFYKARRAFERDENVGDDLAIETLLYAAGTRQIDVAFEIGLSSDTDTAVFLVHPSSDDVGDEIRRETEPPSTREFDRETAYEFYGVTPEELDAVGEHKAEMLVLERVALLDVEK